MTSPLMNPGDFVRMLVDGIPVARGTIVCTQPEDTCHNTRLGDFRVSISVLEAYFDSNPLPYLHVGADTVGEAIGSIVMWDRHYVHPFVPILENSSGPDIIPSRRGQSSSDPNPEPDGESSEPQSRHSVESLVDRSSWYRKLALLYAADRVTLFANGRIVNPDPESCVNDEKLGEDHCGVSVINVVVDSVESRKRFPLFLEGTPCLVKWPILAIKLPRSLEFLGDLIGVEANPPQLEYMPFVRPKRGYNNQNRRPLSEDEKQRRASETRCARKRTAEEINAVYTKDCCKAECCRKFDREVVVNSRNRYHGMSYNDRHTYVLNHLNNRDEFTINKGTIIVNGVHVCKLGFAIIHGFSQQTFYNHYAGYLNGEKKGVHGNDGTTKMKSYVVAFCEGIRSFFKKNAEPMPIFKYPIDEVKW
ncbi:unnamed protein product [Calypogeia fissa]